MSKEKTTLFTLSIVVIISLLCTISSCSKEDYELTDCSTSELSTKEQFAELLSAAITNSEELRFFIKKEALRQYDYIIKSETTDKYELNYYSTGKINFIIVPLK